MVDDLAEITRALSGTVLGGLEVREVEVLDGPDVGFEVTIPGDDLVPAWRAARGLVGELGRWPVAVDAYGEDVYSRFFYYGDDVSPKAILERAESMTPAQALAERNDGSVDAYVASDWDRIVGYSVEDTARRIGAAPSVQEAKRHVPTPSYAALESFLLDWEEDRRPTLEPERTEGPGWYDIGERCVLALLPTSHTEEVPAYTSYYGCSGPAGGHETLVSVMGSWRERFGAELIASWGTMLQFVVSRPPHTIGEAFTLAVEQAAFGIGDDSLREHTRALLHRPTWFLITNP